MVKLWTRQHRALLDALRAEAAVPHLIARLSLERCAASPAQVRMLRDWPASLRGDAGWAVLEPHLERPSAWPRIWHQAIAAGFSPRSDHHHALLFERFCDDLVAQDDFEVARYAWRECVDAWLRVFATDYPDTLLEELGADEATRAGLLDRLCDGRERQLRRGLRLADAQPSTTFDRRLTRFAWSALSVLEERLDQSDAQHPALSGLRERVELARGQIVSTLGSRFGRMIDRLDLAEADAAAIREPFEWIGEVFEILPIDAATAARVSDAAVDIGWKLRKLELGDGEALMAALLELAAPFNDRLAHFIASGDAFGHNSTCADFLVFQGEQRDRSSLREPFFERAIEVCPGHRNASMMLSYEKLREVSSMLVRIRLMPAAVKVVPGASRRLGSVVEDASALLDDAEALFPSNETIAEYRQEIVAEAQRLGAEVPR